MVEGVTKSGFDYHINDEVLNSFDMLRILRKVASGHAEYLVDAEELMFTGSEAERFREHVVRIHGSYAASAVIAELIEIIQSRKNS